MLTHDGFFDPPSVPCRLHQATCVAAFSTALELSFDCASKNCRNSSSIVSNLWIAVVELRAGRDDFDQPDRGGVNDGGEITAIVRPQDNPQAELGIFPGRLEIDFPGHSIIIENMHPMFDFVFTRVWYNGRDVTNNIVDVYLDINAVDNVVQCYITLYRAHWFGSDEVATINIA